MREAALTQFSGFSDINSVRIEFSQACTDFLNLVCGIWSPGAGLARDAHEQTSQHPFHGTSQLKLDERCEGSWLHIKTLDGLMGLFDEIISNRHGSEAERKPLDQCSLCHNRLFDRDFFVISKAFHRGKAVLETVQCLSCQMNSRSYTSEQSMENIMLYSGRRFNAFIQDPIQRKVYHLQDPSCLITGEELQPSDSFELYSFHIPGANLADENFLFIGPTAMDQMGELLSEETRKSWGKFIETLMPHNPDRIPSPMFFG